MFLEYQVNPEYNKPSCQLNYAHVHTCTHMYTHVHTRTHTYTHVHTRTHMYTHVHTCTHMYTHVPSWARKGSYFLLVVPEQRVKPMFVCLFDKCNVLDGLSFKVRSCTRHGDGQLSGESKVFTQKLIEDLHVGLLLEEYMIGKVLQHLWWIMISIVAVHLALHPITGIHTSYTYMYMYNVHTYTHVHIYITHVYMYVHVHVYVHLCKQVPETFCTCDDVYFHLWDECETSSHNAGNLGLYQVVALRRNDGRVDESQKYGTVYCVYSRVWKMICHNLREREREK